MIHFEIPKNQSSIIKVIGVGGGGGNAVNYMYNMGVEGVDFIVCNTDSQALALSPVPNKIQLGPHLTQGLGAGANPEIGKQASEESTEDVEKMLKVNTKMAFVTAGMGGGTGTGGAPVVARLCRELGILTVGIVTTPFSHEGPRRMKQAKEGIDRLREHVDTILIISNDKLRHQFGSFKFTEAFSKADDVLATATKCITEVITSTGRTNVDFADVSTVMRNGGVAILGHASANGENRALNAVEAALNSPLLNDSDIRGAKWILLNVTSAPGEHEHTLDDMDAINAYVQQMAGENCDVILGMGHDASLDDKIAVTVIATGFQHKDIKHEVTSKPAEVPADQRRIVVALGDEASNQKLTSTAAAERTFDPLAPTMVDTTPAPRMAENTAASSAKQSWHLSSPTIAADIKEEGGIKMVIRDETNGEGEGNYRKSAEELEEDRRFEEQKRALEERAERLRRLSFNVKNGEGADELENIPAYMRRGGSVPQNLPSSDDSTQYSGYTVGYQDPNNQKGGQAVVQTLNTFLDGKKPD
jgi:cell division protein FtsZ